MGKYVVLCAELDEIDREAGFYPDDRPKHIRTYLQGEETDLSDTDEDRIELFLREHLIGEVGKEPEELEGVEAEVQKRLNAGEDPATVKPVDVEAEEKPKNAAPAQGAKKEAPKPT
jgi:hypothetical protein